MMSMYPLTTPLDLQLSREIFKFGPLKWSDHHWTVEVVSPTRRRPGMRQHKSSVPHLYPQKKECGKSANERQRTHTVADTHSGQTYGSDALDNLNSRECDRFREYLRQIVMPSRSRPTPTRANAGRPARVCATEHARRAPDTATEARGMEAADRWRMLPRLLLLDAWIA
ncbi:hypothetical protein EVAR_11160_1 [Eumeta japonica]|uniref:Uncharacterized protein n=1 Tax=Eumeta variegata TaxID=151549 RepID=A0A4C1U4A5_EUMVA|nr:hypothetical protein EVAR_11160_1 [Eumeta japonica]